MTTSDRIRQQNAQTHRPTPAEELAELRELAEYAGALSDPRVSSLLAELAATMPGATS